MNGSQKIERRQYTDQFKQDAVELVSRPGAKLKEVARALGIPAVTLRQWRDRLVGGTPAPTGQTMREQLLSVTMQRDVLKKACGILSEVPPKGMPQ
jgi:transposase